MQSVSKETTESEKMSKAGFEEFFSEAKVFLTVVAGF